MTSHYNLIVVCFNNSGFFIFHLKKNTTQKSPIYLKSIRFCVKLIALAKYVLHELAIILNIICEMIDEITS